MVFVRSPPGGPELDPDDKDAIRIALSGQDFEILQIVRPLGGRSTASVYEGQLDRRGETEGLRVVVKIDTPDRLVRELENVQRCRGAPGGAPNVAGILGPTRVDHSGLRAAIVYRHAAQPRPGETKTLLELCSAALGQEPTARPGQVSELIKRVLGYLSRQVHKQGREELVNATQLAHYEQRWLPSAAIRATAYDPTSQQLWLEGTKKPSAEPLSLGGKQSTVGSGETRRPLREAIGSLVRCRIESVLVRDEEVRGVVPGEGSVRVSVPQALARQLKESPPSSIHVWGELVSERVGAYASLVSEAGLDPACPTWTYGEHTFTNPLVGFGERNLEWEARSALLPFVFGHGDFHGGNVLGVGDDLEIIDLAHAGPGQPYCADAASLLVSLWVEAIVPHLEPEQIPSTLALAFETRPPESGERPAVGAPVRLLRELFESALAGVSSNATPGPAERRDLWIDVHHFCWVALRWSSLGEAPATAIRSLALLAGIAAERVPETRLALVRHQEDRAVAQVVATGEVLVDRLEATGDAHPLLNQYSSLFDQIGEQLERALATPPARIQLLADTLDQAAHKPDWGAGEVALLNQIRSQRKELGPADEVMLVDALFLGFLRKQTPNALYTLLEFCDSGEPEVALEAHLVVALLHASDGFQAALDPALARRAARSLLRPQAQDMGQRIAESLGRSQAQLTTDLLQKLKDQGSGSPSWTLRPFRAREHLLKASPSHARFLEGLEASRSLSDLEKHALALAYDQHLSTWQRQGLIRIFDEEREKWTQVSYPRFDAYFDRRLASLLQWARFVANDPWNVERALSAMSRTLVEILHEEAAARPVALRTLAASLLRGNRLPRLQVLSSTAAGQIGESGWQESLSELVEEGVLDAYLGTLRLGAAGHPPDPELTLLVTALSGASGSPGEVLVSREGRVALLRVLSPEVFSYFESCLCGADLSPSAAIALALYMTDRDADVTERLYRMALQADPYHAPILGHFAVFMRYVREDMDAAEELYRRALQSDPNHVHNIGNLALFMGEVRKDEDAAEDLYRRALKADPNHARTLGCFAVFMETTRNDMDAAEDLYRRALKADPNHARNLGCFAVFMETTRRDMDAAEHLYRRALGADPKGARSLGNFAVFMQNTRKDMDAAEDLYRRALEADPNHGRNLGCFAVFMETTRRDVDAAEDLYRRALKVDPKHAHNLCNFADFMENTRKDMDAAEDLYRRAVQADPNHPEVLSNFAWFTWHIRKDMDAAEDLYRRAVQADSNHARVLGSLALMLHKSRQAPDRALPFYERAVARKPCDPNHLCNLAGALFVLGRLEEAESRVEQARHYAPLPDPMALELAFYEYAHLPAKREEALEKLETLLEAGVVSDDFDLEPDVEAATARGHPEPERLREFARRISGLGHDDEGAE